MTFFPLQELKLVTEVAVEMPGFWWCTTVSRAIDFVTSTGPIAQGTLSNTYLPLGGLNPPVL